MSSVDNAAIEAPVGCNEEVTPKQEKHASSKRITGTVKWYNVKEGFGFVTRHDTGEDVFIHKSSILKANPKHRAKSVGDGEVIEFGLVASKVTAPGFKPVKGSPFVASQGRNRRPKSSTSGRRTNPDDRKKVDTVGDGLDLKANHKITVKKEPKSELVVRIPSNSESTINVAEAAVKQELEPKPRAHAASLNLNSLTTYESRPTADEVNTVQQVLPSESLYAESAPSASDESDNSTD